jgi:hypothetical protein
LSTIIGRRVSAVDAGEEQDHQDDGDVDPSRSHEDGQDGEERRPHHVDGDDETTAIESVGQSPGMETEEQRWQPLRQESGAHHPRVLGERSDEERPGSEGEAVSDAGDHRCAEQPAKAGPEPGREDSLHEAAPQWSHLEPHGSLITADRSRSGPNRVVSTILAR